ncbi:outer membrane autotransporter protein [Xanthomonas sacchari]|uniref:putative Ig domain-containing protein n=1 Tax=Xanthomonas sp. F10 TaxID=3035309 RepID=UPI0017C7C253|nr:putative Ig domain-containing protein [Xanthomonas sp. F10]MBB6368615.1 outer membrane autotransporter protein [Xanthomonas sp. F10]
MRLTLRWLMALLLLAMSQVCLAAGPYCTTPQTATVNSGGSVTFDVSSCDGPSNTGMSDGAQPSHGNYVLTGQLDAAGTERVTYTNNGDGATSDSFYLLDEDNNQVVFNITVNPSRTASIAVSPSSANEDSGAAFVYTVTLSSTNSSATTVNLTRSGTATSGTDYTGAVTSVVVPANASSASFSITPVADSTVEADETVIFQVASGSGYSIGNPSSATATIVNDDYPSASIAVSPASVAEDGSANLVYTVTLSQASPSALSIGFNVGGTATSGTDYAAVNSPLVIAAGQTSGTITIDPTPDTTVEPDETVVISLNAGSGYTVGSPSSATGTILNDDQPALSINDVSQNEGNAGNTAFTFTVSLSQPAGSGGVSFDIATANGTATAGTDYIASSVNGLTIAAGSSSATFTVQVVGDTLNEPDETFFVNVTNVSGATVADGQGQGTIVNDDAAPALSVGDVSVTEGNSGTTTATFPVSLSAASGQTVTVNYATADGSANAGSDYVARSGTLTFSPGTTVQNVAVTINGDTTVEPDETFTLNLSGASNASIARATATGTILNDDATVTIAPASLPAATAGSAYSQTVLASGGTAPYTFSLTAGALPAGLTLSSAGVLSGTPTASGSFNFTLSATDSGTPTSGSRAYTLTVAAPTLTLPATTLPNGTAGQAYSAAVTPASGGIAPYAYTVSAGALPAGVTVNGASGALSGTPTVAGNFSFTLTATDSTSGTAGQAARSYTLAIVSPTLTVAPSTLPPGTAGTAYSQTLSTSGGTAPYSYALSSGALPAGLSLSGAGVLSGTPTVAGSFTFVIGVTDAGGFGGSHAYTLAIASPTLVITPPTLPAAAIAASYSQALSTSGGTAPYSYALTAGALPSGMSLSAGGVLSGTPTTAGNFAFTVRVTDANAFTAAQAFTLTVASPTLTLVPPSLPAGTAGTAYSQALSATGGTAPYSYSIATGALPAGLSLSAAGVLSGTPTQAGSFVFTATVTDSTAGVPGQASRSYTLSIAAPTLAPGQPTLPAGTAGTAYNQTLTTSGGTAPYSYSVVTGALPTGLSLTAAGVLSGTPSAAGSFAFSIKVSDANGFSATQAYTLTIASAMPAPVAANDTGATLVETALTLEVTGNDTGSIDSIAVATAPSHGTATVDGMRLVYTPAPGYVGVDSVHYIAVGAGGSSAPAIVTITVNARPIAASAMVPAVTGQAQTLDVTRNATGGPFVAAAVVAVLPANAGTATITRAAAKAAGVPTAAADEGPGFMLTFVPNPAFSGNATVRFTLSNAYATSAEADIVFMIAPRPDPTQDAQVRGLIDAQAESTRRFAKAQIDNFQRRLEATHRGARGFDNGVSFQATSHCRQRDRTLQSDRNLDAQACDPANRDLRDNAMDGGADTSAAPRETGTAAGDLGLWVGGAIRSGSLDQQSQRAGVDFQTDGLSVGADYRVSPSFALGAGVGWGRDDSDVGHDGSRSTSTAYTLALYASYHPGQTLFFDTLVGYQLLSYDLRRYVTDNGALAEGDRSGHQWIASLSAGADLQRGDWQITPYARVDAARATLDAYSEATMAPYALRYEDMDVATTTGNLGLRLEWRRQMTWGRLTPQFRLEYQHDFQGRGDATLGYADIVGGTLYRTGQSVYDRNRLMLGVGVVFSTDQGLSTRVEYRGVTDGDSGSDQTWMFNVEKKY